VVTTPQEVALMDVRKELSFCSKTGVRVLGVVENMSGFACPGCSRVTHVFSPGAGGPESSAAATMSAAFGTSVVARLPLDPRLGECCEGGEAAVEAYPEAHFSAELLRVASSVTSADALEKLEEGRTRGSVPAVPAKAAEVRVEAESEAGDLVQERKVE